jgi:hypothetical protein
MEKVITYKQQPQEDYSIYTNFQTKSTLKQQTKNLLENKKEYFAMIKRINPSGNLNNLKPIYT